MHEKIAERLTIIEWTGDLAFVASSWIASFVAESNLCKGVPKGLGAKEQTRVVNRLLPYSRILAACDREDPDVIYGYIVFEKIDGVALIHYVYVKRPFQNFGIANAMIDMVRLKIHTDKDLPMITDHSTIHALRLRKHGIVYNPFLLINRNRSENNEAQKLEACKPHSSRHAASQ